MTILADLIVGTFYWVVPEPDLERDDEWEPGLQWQDDMQPARFNGWSANGEMLWNFMAVDGSSDWPVLWIGEAVGVPILGVPAQETVFPPRLIRSNYGK